MELIERSAIYKAHEANSGVAELNLSHRKDFALTMGGTYMYFVSLNYIRPNDEIEEHLDAHRAFLDDQFAKGRFLAAGAKVPRTGGVFLIRGTVSLAEVNDLIREDPFHQNGVAEYDITEFAPSKHHVALADIL